jgi:hypothetical protein
LIAATCFIVSVRNDVEAVGPINALQFGRLLVARAVVVYFLGERFRIS